MPRRTKTIPRKVFLKIYGQILFLLFSEARPRSVWINILTTPATTMTSYILIRALTYS